MGSDPIVSSIQSKTEKKITRGNSMSKIIFGKKEAFRKDLDDILAKKARRYGLRQAFESRKSKIIEIVDNREACMSQVTWEESK